ncbi:MAG TPA: type III pantothenate kinase [Dokdonella sp.]|uniref:type III pantothenate kinase n=1 Tax=Dokdonella sp. TaxID=2291710 RepID=UPI002D7E79D1|nr:type III pantothenate kinase [Dokdonella sp.]HET9031629.1 type III pantothenate kinase [Dokdonella sp.]
MKLLVDFGNTRLKWAIWKDAKHSMGGVFAHADTSLEAALSSNWAALGQPEAILVASVVNAELEQQLSELIKVHFDCEAEFVRSPAAAIGIRNAYAEPARLGVDRFLGLAALHASAQRAQILVSCGTALTLDAIDAEGRHLGGLIAPSPALMRSAVGSGTARVGEEHGELVEIATCTADAVWSGSVLSAVALIERFHATVVARLGAPVAVVGDGGGLEEWMHLLPNIERGRDLVVRGLALWSESGGR